MSSTLTLEVEDFTGQIRRRVRGVPIDATVSDLINGSTRELNVAEVDASGRPIQYGAQTSGGETLNGSDRLGDVLQDNETITLTKSVTAG
jgi:hypothetical protein